MFKLRIYFAGLCLFEPRNGNMDVIFMDAENPREDLGIPIPTHTSVLQFNTNDEVESDDQTGTSKIFAGNTKKLWRLDNEIIELTSRTSQRSLTPLQPNRPLGVVPMDLNSATRFDWIGPLFGAGFQPRRVKNDILNPRANNSDPSHKATIRLTKGTLRTAAFASIRGRFLIWNLAPGVQRAVASVIEYEVDITDNQVNLESREFTGRVKRTLTLRPAERRSSVEIWAMNRNLAAIMEQKLLRNIEHSLLPLGMPYPENRFYHKLIDNPPSTAEAPLHMPAFVGYGITNQSPVVLPCVDESMNEIFFTINDGEPGGSLAPCSPTGG